MSPRHTEQGVAVFCALAALYICFLIGLVLYVAKQAAAAPPEEMPASWSDVLFFEHDGYRGAFWVYPSGTGMYCFAPTIAAVNAWQMPPKGIGEPALEYAARLFADAQIDALNNAGRAACRKACQMVYPNLDCYPPLSPQWVVAPWRAGDTTRNVYKADATLTQPGDREYVGEANVGAACGEQVYLNGELVCYYKSCKEDPYQIRHITATNGNAGATFCHKQ